MKNCVGYTYVVWVCMYGVYGVWCLNGIEMCPIPWSLYAWESVSRGSTHLHSVN